MTQKICVRSESATIPLSLNLFHRYRTQSLSEVYPKVLVGSGQDHYDIACSSETQRERN